jgi:hypothetical protein
MRHGTEAAPPLQRVNAAPREPPPAAAIASALRTARECLLPPSGFWQRGAGAGRGRGDRLGPAVLGAGGQGQERGREPECLEWSRSTLSTASSSRPRYRRVLPLQFARAGTPFLDSSIVLTSRQRMRSSDVR